MAQILSARLEMLQASSDQRLENRRRLCLQVAGSVESDENFNATVRDLSQTGFLMDSSVDLARGEMIHVEFPRRGRVAARVAWVDGRLTGCQFLEPISSGSVSAALLGAMPQSAPLLAAGPSLQVNPNGEQELSPRQKAIILVALASFSWGVLAALSYTAMHLLHA